MATGILLEAGTNEMELLVFRVGQSYFGVNVAKVRELVQRIKTLSIPHAPEAVEGSFRLREEVLTLINLSRYLRLEAACLQAGEGLIIIVELNNTRCGILVDAVEMIHRLSWDRIEPPSPFIAETGTPVTATAMVDNRVILILDFETIISDLLGRGSVAKEEPPEEERATASIEDGRILMADDSPIVRDTIAKALQLAGYRNVTVCNDGEHAWQTIISQRQSEGKPFDVVLSDIEMPRMDGLHLTARIKHDQELAGIPVILFSSIVSDENLNKGRAVGADAQVAKTDVDGLLLTIRAQLEKSMQN